MLHACTFRISRALARSTMCEFRIRSGRLVGTTAKLALACDAGHLLP